MEFSARFTVLRYPQHFEEIRALRRLAYGRAGKSGPDPIRLEGPDRRDLESRVVAGWVGQNLDNETLVTSIRLNRPVPGPRLHHTCRLRGEVSTLPAVDSTTECGWGCVHPEFHGRGLVWELAAHMVLAARQMGRPYVISGTDAQVWPMWERTGFRRTGAMYTGAVSGNDYWVMVLDIDAVLTGRQRLGRRFAATLDATRDRLGDAETVEAMESDVV